MVGIAGAPGMRTRTDSTEMPSKGAGRAAGRDPGSRMMASWVMRPGSSASSSLGIGSTGAGALGTWLRRTSGMGISELPVRVIAGARTTLEPKTGVGARGRRKERRLALRDSARSSLSSAACIALKEARTTRTGASR